MVQIARGDYLITARVMWTEAGRAGLRSEDRLPIEEILSLKHVSGLRLIASNGALHDRRNTSRPEKQQPRMSGRAIEFIAIVAIAVTLAVTAWDMAEQAMVKPLASAAAALG
jgi:hypothetical protein